MGDLLNQQHKFAGVLTDHPVLTFSNKKNISPEQLQKECSEWLGKNKQHTLNVSAFEKADGAATLFVVAFQIHKKRPPLKDDMIEWPSSLDLNDDNAIPDWSNLAFNEMMKLFVNNDKMWVMRQIKNEGGESKYVSIRVMLYPPHIETEKATHAKTDENGDQVITPNQPPPRLQSLYIPHYLRIAMQDFVLRSKTMMQLKTGQIHLRAYRCELVMGSEGPWKATSWIKKCRHLKTFGTPNSVLEKQQFLQYCWKRQFDTTDINLKNGVELIVLDDVTRSLDESYIKQNFFDNKVLPKSFLKLMPSHIRTYPERLESLRHDFIINNDERHERYLLVSLVRRVISSNHDHTRNDFLKNEIKKLKNRLERYNVCKDGEGFMIAVTASTSQHTSFCKLKPFQFVTLSHFEAKTQFNESIEKDEWMKQYADRQKYTLIHLFNGSHFWMTNNLDKITYDGTLWKKMTKSKEEPKCPEISFANGKSVNDGILLTASEHEKYIAHDTYKFDNPESVFADNDFKNLRFFRAEENGKIVFYTQSPASIVYAKNCFRLTRWGAFKDINTKDPEKTGDRLQDISVLWENSHRLFIWAQYFKDARVRLNMKPLNTLNRYTRIKEFATQNANKAQLVRDSLNDTNEANKDEKYEQQVFQDILTIRFMFLLYLSFHESKRHSDECEECYMRFGIIMRQMLKNWNAYTDTDRRRLESADDQIMNSTNFFDIKEDPFCMQEIEFQKIPILRTQFGQGNNSGKKDARDKRRQSNEICNQTDPSKSIPDIIKWLSRNTAGQKELSKTFKPDHTLKRILYEQNFEEDCKEERLALSWYIKHYGTYFSWNAGGLARMDARNRIREFNTKQKKEPYKINRYIPDTKINLILPKVENLGGKLVYEPQARNVEEFFDKCGVENDNVITCITKCIETLQAKQETFKKNQHNEINLFDTLQDLSTLLSDEVRDNIWQQFKHPSDWWIDFIFAQDFKDQNGDEKFYQGKIQEFDAKNNKILWEDDGKQKLSNKDLWQCIKYEARDRFENVHVFFHHYTENMKKACDNYMKTAINDLHVLDLQLISDIFESIKNKFKSGELKNNDGEDGRKHGLGNLTSEENPWSLKRLYTEMKKTKSQHPDADFDALLLCEWIAKQENLQSILEDKKEKTPFRTNDGIKFVNELLKIRSGAPNATVTTKLSVTFPVLRLDSNIFTSIETQIEDLLNSYPEQYMRKKSSDRAEDQDEFVIDEEEDNLISEVQDDKEENILDEEMAGQDESAQGTSNVEPENEIENEIEEQAQRASMEEQEEEASEEEDSTEEEANEEEDITEEEASEEEDTDDDSADPNYVPSPTASHVGRGRAASVERYGDARVSTEPSPGRRESSLESFVSNTSTTSQLNHSREFKLFLMLIWKCKQEKPDADFRPLLEKLADLYYHSDLKPFFPDNDET